MHVHGAVHSPRRTSPSLSLSLFPARAVPSRHDSIPLGDYRFGALSGGANSTPSDWLYLLPITDPANHLRLGLAMKFGSEVPMTMALHP